MLEQKSKTSAKLYEKVVKISKRNIENMFDICFSNGKKQSNYPNAGKKIENICKVVWKCRKDTKRKHLKKHVWKLDLQRKNKTIALMLERKSKISAKVVWKCHTGIKINIENALENFFLQQKNRNKSPNAREKIENICKVVWKRRKDIKRNIEIALENFFLQQKNRNKSPNVREKIENICKVVWKRRKDI